MKPYLADPDVTLFHGDALDVLRELPDESVHCIATSPPFYALRDYGTGTWEGGDEGCDHKAPSRFDYPLQANLGGDRPKPLTQESNAGSAASQYRDTCGKCGARRIDQQIGLEETPDTWAAALVAVFREARRVLRKDGTLWVECGDSYAQGHGGSSTESAVTMRKAARGPGAVSNNDDYVRRKGIRNIVPGLKPKDLLGTPWLLAFALRADGWWLRGCNIWAKPNAMPESAKDRCTTAHSYVFQLSKSARYFFDGDAIREEGSGLNGGGFSRSYAEAQPGHGAMRLERPQVEGRNPRSVWTIPTQGYPEAHFATWPEALARRIILAGCPESVCQECGKARERVVEKVGERATHGVNRVADAARSHEPLRENGTRHGSTSVFSTGTVAVTKTLGFTDCGHNAYEPGFVLDPFVGSGTTCFVARKHGRRSIGIDLNPEYLKLAAKRLQQQSLFAEPAA